MWKLEKNRLTTKYGILRSLVPFVKHYFVNMGGDDNHFKLTCQRYNGFVTCKGGSGEVVYVTFLHAGISTLGLYPEELFPENFCFQ